MLPHSLVSLVLISTPMADPFEGKKAGESREVDGMKLRWCPPGTFTMGSPADEPERRPGEDRVEVKLTKGFWAGQFEVTQGQWKRVVGDFPDKKPTAEWGLGDDVPVYWVNYAEANDFCDKLTAKARRAGSLPAGWAFRLPTEAQWEYACRAGTTTIFWTGNTLSSTQANFLGSTPFNGAEKGPDVNKAVAVGRYPANAWGLHDMHGNIYEWCRDWYHANLPGGTDPDLTNAKETAQKNRTGDYSRSRRGGAWTDPGKFVRTAFRLRYEPERRSDHIGFRVVLVKE
jgi:sulfatase modifying factor 1